MHLSAEKSLLSNLHLRAELARAEQLNHSRRAPQRGSRKYLKSQGSRKKGHDILHGLVFRWESGTINSFDPTAIVIPHEHRGRWGGQLFIPPWTLNVQLFLPKLKQAQ